MRETWVGSLGWEDSLEKGTITHSSILAWRIPWTIVHGVAKSWTWLSNFHFHLCMYMFFWNSLAFSMIQRILAWVWASSGSWWWTGKPGVLQSMGSQRVRHDWATELNWTDISIYLSMIKDWTCGPYIGNTESYFICFCLCWVFVAVRATFQLHAQSSHCSGFTLCGAWAPGCEGFRSWGTGAQQLWPPGSRAQAQ